MELKRNCPKCNKFIFYKKIEYINKAIKNNKLCRKCSAWDRSGEKNPMYGKKHTNENREKISKSKIGKINNSKTKYKKGENIGDKNKMYRKSVYNIWIEKYGKEKADILLQKLKDKHSKNNTGKNNPMYGKPIPQGTGNGWKGWYKNIYFRSLRELSFMYKLDLENKKWKTAETKEFIIKYNQDGKDRTYRPDFLVENKFLIEIKPKKLHNSYNIKIKKDAAEKFAKINGYIYNLIDCEILDKNIIKNLIELGEIKFLDKYLVKFNNFK